jgi:hypothetical protein
MPARTRREGAPAYVTIVSRNRETTDGLHQYLGRAGITSRSTQAVDDVACVAPDDATAVVIFPDDFAEEAVLALVAELRRRRPRLVTVLVTQAPNRFLSALSADDERLPLPTVMPKPSFGWTILDAIRGERRQR